MSLARAFAAVMIPLGLAAGVYRLNGGNEAARPPVGFITDAALNAWCNATLVGPDTISSAKHCYSDEPQTFSIYDRTGNFRTVKIASHVFPGSAWLDNVQAPEKFSNTSEFQFRVRDQIIMRLEEPIGLIAGRMQPKSLDHLRWTPIPDTDLASADVSSSHYMPRFLDKEVLKNPKKYITFNTVQCKIVRSNKFNAVVAHTCPADHGMSGASLYSIEPNGDYAHIAVISGDAPDYSERHATTLSKNNLALTREFQPLLKTLPNPLRAGSKIQTRSIHLGTTIYEFTRHCAKNIGNCAIR